MSIDPKDVVRLRKLHARYGSKAWEPGNPFHPWIDTMIEAGFLRRLDGRCGFEAFKDAMLIFTQAGHMAMSI